MATTLRVFLPFALGYLVGYLVRAINAVAGEPIARDFGLEPGALGLLTSLFFAGFGLAQLPLGVLMDRFGPRRVKAATLVLLAAGAALFSVASSLAELAAGRFLMGVGASMSLMAPLTAYRVWFDARRLPLVNGLHLSFGALGGAIGGAPAGVLVERLGWQPVFAILAAVALVLAAAILKIVPARREPEGRPRLSELTAAFRTIAAAPAFWRIAPLSAATQATLLSVGSLWTGPWLLDVAGFPALAAAEWLSIYSLSLIVGFVGTGYLMNRAGGLAAAERVVALGMAGFLAVQVLILALPPAAGVVLFLAWNVLGSASALTYAVMARYFPGAMAGRVNTALNFIVFIAAFLAQWLFGVLLDFFPDGAGGTRPAGYAAGFAVLLALQALAFVPWYAIRAEPVATPDGPAAGAEDG